MGYDKCWFFGDTFGYSSFEQYFQARLSSDYNGYVKAHYDTRGFFGSFHSDNPSTISHVVNLMANAITCKTENKLYPLPKLVIIVPDGDLMKEFKDRHSVTKLFTKILNYIMTQHYRAILSFKEYLPAKAIQKDHPQILWIQLPLHNNFEDNKHREKFNKSLKVVSRLHSNVATLMLKKVWDPHDIDLFWIVSQHFTASGYHSYSEAIDHTVRYFDSVVLPKRLAQFKRKNLNSAGKNPAEPQDKNRFHWQTLHLTKTVDPDQSFAHYPNRLVLNSFALELVLSPAAFISCYNCMQLYRIPLFVFGAVTNLVKPCCLLCGRLCTQTGQQFAILQLIIPVYFKYFSYFSNM